jgi:hypothetical protein
MLTTHADVINADLLAFIKGQQGKGARPATSSGCQG